MTQSGAVFTVSSSLAIELIDCWAQSVGRHFKRVRCRNGRSLGNSCFGNTRAFTAATADDYFQSRSSSSADAHQTGPRE